MKAKVITIGDEILIGQIVDTNSAFISKELIDIGIEVSEILTIGDSKKNILNSLEKSQNNFDIVILTGGLGPTNDDITKEAFCDYFKDKLVLNKEVLKHIESLFKNFKDNPINDLNRAQAYLPSRAKLIPNNFGTAAGMMVKNLNTLYISLPGVPFEMKSMVSTYLIPEIKNEFECPVILNKTLLTYGLGESTIANKLKEFESSLPSNFKLAYLPNLGRVRLRLSAKGDDKKVLENTMDSLIDQLYIILDKIIIGFESSNPIEKEIGKKLIQFNHTVSTAESLTGGLISSRLTSIPGSSNYFKGSVVAYNTLVKKNVLKVNADLILKHSVVSVEVANEMALGAKKIFDTDYAIATTGNAGPSKGDSDQSVGNVFISISTPTDLKSFEFNFGKNREKNVYKTVNKALELFFSELLTRQ
ncbi:MAG: CinA family nicotinamide mononucleotide deamidase-related protein [Flavobacteriaceae bacterium]|jgi:nicotinamide-nucleotide amidase|nr:CinA family nicotinamide mononucleotide deamidase-related protein [Flavobacteriaceae bacterium]MBT4063248.1 CinA family nicotinamide mononucleotide deamidase-related protein [Flavobacteriaceae bacterium]MBT4246440.1 CinA family nicotinamide mononucleotide deamidase-related protein [Flavobacteriaceae bacterium]MBT4416090.1 CinA family nicotinamide mononucleotide deamidase-related protein [Flavobacteriaceae bacterium]MBT5011872.1 CinA family nicotinamide mononucleotide deamidase-related protei